MTLAAMWVESRSSEGGTLCFASDSRTRPGPIEGVSKVLLFSRSDIAGVWAGDFRYAALLADHLDIALASTEQMRTRAMDVHRLFRATQQQITDHLSATMVSTADALINPAAQDPDRMTMLIGGYSISDSKFMTIRITWRESQQRWVVSVQPVDPGQISMIGNKSHTERAKWMARKIRRHRHGSGDDWHMEPLAAIDYYRREQNAATIGGDLQLAKAFMHGAAAPYGIKQPLEEMISVRGTRFGPRVAEEYRARNLLVDMSRWSLGEAAYGGVRVAL
jgi:hypothetical protein